MKLGRIYDKVINQKRGGYCYELNYLFHSLLREIGFESHLISSRIYENGEFGPEFDYMSVLVCLEEKWLVDVGFGDLFLEPVKITTEMLQEDQFKAYRIVKIDQNKYLLTESLKKNSEFINKYIFGLLPRKITDFADQNKFKQKASESYFVKNTVCTLPTKDGRKTILKDKFRIRKEKTVEERKIKGGEELRSILKDEFNIELKGTVYNMR